MVLQEYLSQYTPNWDALKEYSNGLDWKSLKDVKVIGAFIVVCGTTYVVYKQATKKRYKLPPGPMPLPLIGNFHNLGMSYLHEKYTALSKVYGPVFTVYLGPITTVIINDYAHMKEAFLVKGADYGNRPVLFSTEIFSENGKDIASGQYGPVWKLQRKIAHAALRKYAGGDKIAKLVKDSCAMVFEKLDKLEGPIDLDPHFNMFIYNIFATMCFGKLYAEDDPFVVFMQESLKKIVDAGPMAAMVDFFPILQKDFLNVKVVQDLKEMSKTSVKHFGDEYDEHLKNYDPDHLTDLTYDLIHLAKEAEKDASQQSEYLQLTRTHFLMVIFDVFFAGTDSTRITLGFIFKYLVKYPEVQQRIYDEMEEVLGSGGVEELTLKSRENLHYLQAVIYEVMRIRPVAPFGVPHVTARDTTLGEYEIPKDTFVFANTWSMHMDPTEFPEPEAFKPERFLDADGSFNPRIGPWVPFSMGKRSCVGEALAKVEISLTTAMFVRKYKFEAVPGEVLDMRGMELMGGFLPHPYKVLITPRK